MSYEQLMRHAADIRDRAAIEAIREQRLPPYDRTGNPRTADERAGALTASRQKVLAQGLADIPSLFQPFAEMPSPDAFAGPRNRADGAAAALATGTQSTSPLDGTGYPVSLAYSEIQDVRTVLARWHGPAANEFRTNFLTPFPERLTNQFMIGLLLRGALDAEREIWARARTDIDQIAHGTLHALDALGDCTKFEWTMTFTVLASVATVAALPLGVTAFGLTITLVGASSQVVAAGAPDDPPRTEYSGRTVNGVLDNMRDAIARVTSAINDQESRIADALSAGLAAVRAERNKFVAPRPHLVGAGRTGIRDELGGAF
ncbi:hypothetical protein [Cryptosporangium sp. NPDC048952]|uniref:hypothetical protein n=1 Tax=Cryptosporangium sp. NPDC048952 TaxID=3363961 RepID=UPI003724363F